MEYQAAVFVGRFQPFHVGHKAVIDQALDVAENVIVIIGSARGARTPKNPFTYEERQTVIAHQYVENYARRVHIHPCRDYYYNENAWLAAVQHVVDREVPRGSSVVLVGQYRDQSSYYLKQFPQWDFIPLETPKAKSTEIREALYAGMEGQMTSYDGRFSDESLKALAPVFRKLEDRGVLPVASMGQLMAWTLTKDFANAVKEWRYLRDYRKSWESAPFPPVFVTTDAIVVCSGHVLVVERKVNPGKGLFAVPGGFIKPNEAIRDACLRELREETGIGVDKLILESSIVDSHVFDHPDRSLRGRTISHGFYFRLKDGKLPEVKGGDDAAEAFWMPLMDVARHEDGFFEDHAHVIGYFTQLGAQGER